MRLAVGAAGHVKLHTVHHLREPSKTTNGSAAQRSAAQQQTKCRRRLVYSALE